MGLGRREIQAFTPCDVCGTGSWCRYGAVTLCLRCAILPSPELDAGPHGDTCDCDACLSVVKPWLVEWREGR